MTSFHFVGISKITLLTKPGAIPVLRECEIALKLSSNLKEHSYLNEDGSPTKSGVKPLTQAFIQGLIANVRHAAASGFMSEGEHMEYIMNELNRSFTYPNVELSKKPTE